MAYFEMLKRDKSRLEDTYGRTNIMPLGSGALAATTYHWTDKMLLNSLDLMILHIIALMAFQTGIFALNF